MINVNKLPNGIRCVVEQAPNTSLVHCGFVLDIGSLDEADHQLGLVHFWEHMAFKGTKNRNGYQIIHSLEKYGGEINAFTTKEKICFYASVLENFVEEAIELLVDITFNSIFPDDEIERERKVILEEMSMYLNSPEDAILDHFDALVFDGHRLGSNILGTERIINNIEQKDFSKFIDEHLDTSRIVFSLISGIEASKVTDLINKHIGVVKSKTSIKNNRTPFNVTSFNAKRRAFHNSSSQSQIVLGCPSYSRSDDKKLPFYLLNNILGGPSLISKLNYNLREEQGLVYQVDSTFQTYDSVGLFYISFGTALEKVEKTIVSTYKIMHELQNTFDQEMLNWAKLQMKGQLAMSEENNMSKMITYAKSILDRGHVLTLENLFEDIDNIRLDDMHKVADEMFTKTLSVLIYHPRTDE